MRFSRTFVIVLMSGVRGAGLLAQRGGGTRVAAGQECPPGTTETRPGSCQAPQTAPPSIVDYRPKSTLVTVEHKVPKAKFPVIDIHSHQGPLTQDSMKRLVETMDPLNLRGPDARRQHQRRSPGPDGRGDQRVAVQGSLPRARRHRLPQCRPGLGGQGDCAAARRHQGRRDWRRRSAASSLACASPSRMARD